MKITETERFKAELLDTNANRILFSAPFGAGKSYFLEDFFKKNSNYNFINLYPVDYSVTSNDDIFEIIKFDVLDALLSRYKDEIKLTEEDINQALITQEFLRNEINYYEIFKVLAKHFVPGGKAITDSVDILKKQFDEHNTFSDSMKRKPSDNAINFINHIRSTKNSIRELDDVSLMIKSFVERVTSSNKKPFVLIVDDLDRLDPEHIFRIINVFTAHQDSKTEINKFGFDKVVFVCDINNIEQMFKHRFGDKADFTGYIDKFYSKSIFNFDNKIFLKEIFMSEFISPKRPANQDKNWHVDSLKKIAKNSIVIEVFNRILIDLIDNENLRIRAFMKFQSLDLPKQELRIFGMTFNSSEYEFLILVFLLRQLKPRIGDLISAIAEMSLAYKKQISRRDVQLNIDFNNHIIDICLPFKYPDTGLSRDFEQGDKMVGYEQEGGTFMLHTQTIHNHKSHFPIFRLEKLESTSSSIFNPYQFLLETLINAKSKLLID